MLLSVIILRTKLSMQAKTPLSLSFVTSSPFTPTLYDINATRLKCVARLAGTRHNFSGVSRLVLLGETRGCESLRKTGYHWWDGEEVMEWTWGDPMFSSQLPSQVDETIDHPASPS